MRCPASGVVGIGAPFSVRLAPRVRRLLGGMRFVNEVKTAEGLLGLVTGQSFADGNSHNMLPPSDPMFRAELEPGVARLVEVLVCEFGWLTYSSCEGHLRGDHVSERAVGLLPRTPSEARDITSVVGTAARTARRRTPKSAAVPRVRRVPLRVEGRSLLAVDVRLAARWPRRYFEDLSETYQAVVDELEWVAARNAEAVS